MGFWDISQDDGGELIAAASGAFRSTWDNPFRDVPPGAWYEEAVQYVYEAGLMQGTTGSTFSPDRASNRGMIAAILYRLEGRPRAGTPPFTDVAADSYCADAVAWASANGVVSGYEDGTFRPGRAITRQEMAVMFYGMLFGTDSILVEDDIKIALGAFKDGDTVASWAREAVAVCYISGIMVGDNGSFKPTDLLSRAQLAQVFRSFYETQLTFVLNELPAAPDQPSTPEQPSVPEQPSMPTAA